MRRNRRVTALGLTATAAMVAALVLPSGAATAKPGDDGNPKVAKGNSGDIRSVGPDYNGGKKQPLDQASLKAAKTKIAEQNARAASGDHQVGDQLRWLALNDVTGSPYLKTYTLRGIGDHIQVWVADDRRFPVGDCRNALGLTNITSKQVNSFVKEFDTNIYPKESASFSVAPNKNGAASPLGTQLGDPDYYKVSAGQADDIVTLVDNVRDANYYDPSTPDGQTYIAGFFYSLFNGYTNRNVMTIDAFDWLHRTGANPPDDQADPDYAACAAKQGQSRPYGAPRPHLYEGTFAHEYQHLLESYASPGELSWINEGLSDYAQTLVGYVDPNLDPEDPKSDGHIRTFLGFQGNSFGGPENSLTNWQDQGGPEILADYGAAYTFMEYLESKYGPSFMEDLHRNKANGLEGLDAVLADHGSSKTGMQTIHDWSAAMALDEATATDPSWSSNGPFAVDNLKARINWDTNQAFSTPGAPPNGSDYVRFRDGAGRYLPVSQLTGGLTFAGSKTLAPDPIKWSSVSNPPTATTADTSCAAVPTGPSGPDNRALYSGCGSNLDNTIARPVTVPSGSPSLTFDALWDTEEGWDFGFVQVSTDNGATWKSLPTADTTSDHDPDAVPNAVENLPGFTGDSETFKSETVDLTPYAGQKVLLGFRYITDGGVDEGGFWVRHLNLGGTTLPVGLSGWKSYSQIKPPAVNGYTVQLVGLNSTDKTAFYKKLDLNSDFEGSLTGAQLKKALGYGSQLAGAIVTFDEPTESITKYARYTLAVNCVVQPGG